MVSITIETEDHEFFDIGFHDGEVSFFILEQTKHDIEMIIQSIREQLVLLFEEE